MSVLDIEFVPDVVKWTHKGLVYNLDIEFEDMHDKNDGSGNSEARGEDAGHELPNGPGADSQMPGNGVAPSTSVPMSTLQFGSFQPAFAPPRLWSDRVESEDVLERTLPPLDFAEVVVSLEGRDDLGQVAPRTPTPAAVSPHRRTQSRLAAEVAVSPIGDGTGLGGDPGKRPRLPRLLWCPGWPSLWRRPSPA